MEQHIKTRFVDGNDAVVQLFNFPLVNVDAHNLIARFGKAGAGNQPYVPRTYYCYFHTIEL
jgi:hypothetical protein